MLLDTGLLSYLRFLLLNPFPFQTFNSKLSLPAGKMPTRMKFLRRPNTFVPPLGPPKPSSRQRALTQWRGLDIAPLEEMRRSAKPTAEVMKRVLKNVRMDCRRKEAEIVQVWNQLLPPDVVAHAQPAGLARGTLFVNVDSSVWLSELVRWRQREILQRLQHGFGRQMIQRISFRLG